MTLCIVRVGDRVLLGMKKQGFGAGRWNGFGGKVKEGESIDIAMRRELLEEAGIEVKNATKAGVVDFEFVAEGGSASSGEILQVHIYRASEFAGEPQESEEMRPEWFHVSKIPLDSMWPDDKYWVPLFLEGKNFRGKFVFGSGDEVLRYNLEVVREA